MNAPMTAERMLRLHADAWGKLAIQNFIFEKWLLEHGEACGPLLLERPDGLRMGEMKQCYQNSFQAVLHCAVDPEEWFYTEGVVLRPDLPITLEHAWLTNRKGEVIDLTLRDQTPDISYFGVPMRPEYVEEKTFRNEDVLKTIDDGRAWPKKAAVAEQAAA